MGALRQPSEDADRHEAPEADLISAFLEIGTFEPERYNVKDEMVLSWRRLWDLCTDYQKKAGVAPPMSLVRERFPDFIVRPNLDPAWAAAEVKDKHAERMLNLGLSEAAAIKRDGNLRDAYARIEAMVKDKPREFHKEPGDVFDHAMLEPDFDYGHIEVPWPTLARLTGGIRPGDLWYMAARFSHGKTFSLAHMAGRSAMSGVDTAFISLEMPAADMTYRILGAMVGSDRELGALLRSEEYHNRKVAQDMLRSRVTGQLRVVDPSYGPISSVDFVHAMCQDYELVFLDHVGLMRTAEGKRAIDDWRFQAQISNDLRQTTLSTHTAVVAAAQVNREGEVKGRDRAPKASHLAGSDALGQDADVVVTQNMLSRRAMVFSAEKVRNGPTGHWHARFEPKKFRFHEITHDEANALMSEDGDFDDWKA